MIPPGKVQVLGFSNADTYKEVIIKGANGLGMEASPARLSLIISNRLVLDSPLSSGLAWNLGNYTKSLVGCRLEERELLAYSCLMMLLMKKQEVAFLILRLYSVLANSLLNIIITLFM